MRALCAFELALVLGHRRCRSPFLLLTDVMLLRHLRRSEDVLPSLIHVQTLDDHLLRDHSGTLAQGSPKKRELR